MCLSNDIIKKLIQNIKKSNKNKSSHWQKRLPEDANFLDEYENLGFGTYAKKTYKNFLKIRKKN